MVGTGSVNLSLGAGFEFTAIAYSGRYPAGTINKSDDEFSPYIRRLRNGRHLYSGLGSRSRHTQEAGKVSRALEQEQHPRLAL